MSSDEDFSLVPQDDKCSILQKIQKEIEKLKAQYESTTKGLKMHIDAKESNLKYANQFQQRCVTLKKNLEDERAKQADLVRKEQEKLDNLKQEQKRLMTEIRNVEKDLKTMEETNQSLKQQTEVSTAVPEKKVVFHGDTAEGAGALSFDMKPYVVYPMEGGTALITFEDELVAEKILALKEHVVQIGDCSITVQAEPVRFLVPARVEMSTNVSPNRILVSNLPKNETVDRILDKLEIYFAKKKNKGGEVDVTDYLEDSKTVVITFVENNIAKGLTDKPTHEVEMEKGRKTKVKVTPFLNGEITLLQTHNLECQKTVLLTGIPNIMEQDNLQDLLEIHFQKTANSGGEVDAIIYNPLGKTMLAVFKEDSAEMEDDQ